VPSRTEPEKTDWKKRRKYMATKKESKPQGPIDAIAAEQLQRPLRGFTAGAADRPMLTAEDRRKADELLVLADEFEKAARAATDYVADPTFGLTNRVRRYHQKTVGTVEMTVAGEVIVAPALESGAVRRHLVDEGTAIVAELESYIEKARAREERKRQAFARQVAALDAAMRIPEAAAAIACWEIFNSSTMLNFTSDYVRKHLHGVREAIAMTLTMAQERKLYDHKLETHDPKELARVIAAWRLVKSEKADAA